MSIKETVINEAIRRIEERSKKLHSLIFANPLGDVIRVREQALEIMEAHKGDYEKIGELIKPLAKKEKELMALSESQAKNCVKWVEEKSKIDFEHDQLRVELYRMGKLERQ